MTQKKTDGIKAYLQECGGMAATILAVLHIATIAILHTQYVYSLRNMYIACALFLYLNCVYTICILPAILSQ